MAIQAPIDTYAYIEDKTERFIEDEIFNIKPINLNPEKTKRVKSLSKIMARYVPMELLQSLSGKLCGHSDVYFANRNGTHYTGKICNPFKGEPSALQMTQRNKFKQVQQALGALTAEQKAAYEVAFRTQKEYKTLRGFMFSQEYAKIND